jgi:hypothetical protein
MIYPRSDCLVGICVVEGQRQLSEPFAESLFEGKSHSVELVFCYVEREVDLHAEFAGCNTDLERAFVCKERDADRVSKRSQELRRCDQCERDSLQSKERKRESEQHTDNLIAQLLTPIGIAQAQSLPSAGFPLSARVTKTTICFSSTVACAVSSVPGRTLEWTEILEAA